MSFTFFNLPNLPSQPNSREQEEPNASTNSTNIIRPSSAQEAGVPIMARRNDGDSCRAKQMRPSKAQNISFKYYEPRD